MSIKKTDNKKQMIEHLKDKEIHYLTFKEDKGEYYLASSSYKLPNDKTPLGCLVSEINESWGKICEDNIANHNLPASIPPYVIGGFKKRLLHEVKESLYSCFKAFKDKNHGFLGDDKISLELKEKLIDARDMLTKKINSLSSINEFFKLSIMLQENSAMSIYLLNLLDK